jgi:hypothetical protein
VRLAWESGELDSQPAIAIVATANKESIVDRIANLR